MQRTIFRLVTTKPTALSWAIFVTFGLLSLLSASALANEPPSAFPDANLGLWDEKSLQGNTRYQLVKEAGVTVLEAKTKNSASLLYKKQKINIAKTPWLDWAWKIDSTYNIDNEQDKAGDDFPARLYVVAKTGVLPWQTIAINYVWSSHQPVGMFWPNPYSDKSMMIVVRSGSDQSGQWVTQRRNVVEDFKTFFNKRVTSIPGFAVMADGDNTLQSGTAYFGDISFSNKPQ